MAICTYSELIAERVVAFKARYTFIRGPGAPIREDNTVSGGPVLNRLLIHLLIRLNEAIIRLPI